MSCKEMHLLVVVSLIKSEGVKATVNRTKKKI